MAQPRYHFYAGDPIASNRGLRSRMTDRGEDPMEDGFRAVAQCSEYTAGTRVYKHG